MKLGIVYNHEGKIINHRSLIKVIFNPIFRCFGFHIVTLYDIETNTLGKVKIKKCKPIYFKWTIKYDVDYNYILKKRILL